MPEQNKSNIRKTPKKRVDPFCLLAYDDVSSYSEPKCPVCKKDLKKAIESASLSGGANVLTKTKNSDMHIDSNRHLAFLYFDAHQCYPEPKLCADGPDESIVIDIVKDFHGGQFDLSWCSLACMRKWFTKLFDAMESQLQSKMDKLRRKALKS